MNQKLYPDTKGNGSSRSRRTKIAAVITFAVVGALFAVNSFTAEVSGSPMLASGAELFENNCARCHGSDGTGGKGPNLASAKRQAKWKDSDEKLIKKITNGGMFMPSFGKKLTPEEIKAIADHVRTLKE